MPYGQKHKHQAEDRPLERDNHDLQTIILTGGQCYQRCPPAFAKVSKDTQLSKVTYSRSFGSEGLSVIWGFCLRYFGVNLALAHASKASYELN